MLLQVRFKNIAYKSPVLLHITLTTFTSLEGNDDLITWWFFLFFYDSLLQYALKRVSFSSHSCQFVAGLKQHCQVKLFFQCLLMIDRWSPLDVNQTLSQSPVGQPSNNSCTHLDRNTHCRHGSVESGNPSQTVVALWSLAYVFFMVHRATH